MRNNAEIPRVIYAVNFLIFLVLLNLFVCHRAIAEIHFIQGQPRAEDRYHLPIYPTVIYRFDDVGKQLERIWVMEKDSNAWDIYVYNDEELILIPEGKDNFATSMNVFHYSDISHPQVIAESNFLPAYDYHLLESKNKRPFIFLKLPYNKNEYNSEYVLIKLKGSLKYTFEKMPRDLYELRLSGPLPPHANGEADVMGVRLSMGDVIPFLSITDLNLPRIPEGTIRIDSSFGWVMFGNTRTYCEIASVPYRSGQKEREILIYNRQTNDGIHT